MTVFSLVSLKDKGGLFAQILHKVAKTAKIPDPSKTFTSRPAYMKLHFYNTHLMNLIEYVILSSATSDTIILRPRARTNLAAK